MSELDQSLQGFEEHYERTVKEWIEAELHSVKPLAWRKLGEGKFIQPRFRSSVPVSDILSLPLHSLSRHTTSGPQLIQPFEGHRYFVLTMPTQQVRHHNVSVFMKPMPGLHPAGDQVVSETVAEFRDGGHVVPLGIGQQQVQTSPQLLRPVQVIFCSHEGVLSVIVAAETAITSCFCNQGSIQLHYERQPEASNPALLPEGEPQG